MLACEGSRRAKRTPREPRGDDSHAMANDNSEVSMRCCTPKSSDEEGLVKRCLQGDESAWVALFSLYNPRLLLTVGSLLRREGRAEQAEEITSRVWYTLCSDA